MRFAVANGSAEFTVLSAMTEVISISATQQCFELKSKRPCKSSIESHRFSNYFKSKRRYHLGNMPSSINPFFSNTSHSNKFFSSPFRDRADTTAPLWKQIFFIVSVLRVVKGQLWTRIEARSANVHSVSVLRMLAMVLKLLLEISIFPAFVPATRYWHIKKSLQTFD